MSWPLDQPIRLTFLTYSDAARTTLADATTVVLSLKAPDGTISIPAVVHDSTGTYHYDPPNTTAGLYAYQWTATGAVTTSTRSGAFSVDEQFPAVLVGLDDARTETNTTSTASDDELQTYVYTASALLLNHPAYRVRDACQVSPYTEWVNAGSDTIVLKHYPVTAVTSVTEYAGTASQPIAAEPLDGGTFTGYGWDYEDGTGANGMLVRTSSGVPLPWQGNRVKVVYTAGSGIVPQDIRLAVLALIDHLWEMQRGGEGEGLPTGNDLESVGTFGQAFGPSFALPNRVRELLEPYRKAPAVA